MNKFFLLIVASFILINNSYAKIYISHYDTIKFNANLNSSPEIVKYYNKEKILIVTENTKKEIHFLKYKDNENKFKKKNIIRTYSKKINSLDICEEKEILAYSFEDNYGKGKVNIFDIKNMLQIKSILVGYNPDMIKFSSDCNLIVVANEGERNKYKFKNSPGSVSFLKINYNKKNISELKYSEIFFDKKINLKKEDSILLKRIENDLYIDFEPEYIEFDKDEKYIIVTLQENNALAKINLQKEKIEYVKGLGFKKFDKSCEIDNFYDGKIKLNHTKLSATYQPDAIILVDEKKNIFAIANEGDSLNNKHIKTKITANSSISKVLDKELIGTKTDLLIGARSTSLINDNLDLIYDSCDDYEKYIAENSKNNFNISKSSTNIDISSAKNGPAPEMFALLRLHNSTYLFTVLENIGGFFIHQYQDNSLLPIAFVKKKSNLVLGPEGIDIFKLDGHYYIVICNEISGDMDLYKINNF